MDQIPSTDNDDVNDECSSQNNALVNPSEGNVFESSSVVSNEITSGCSNNQNESSLLETESRTDENDVSSTSYAENEVITNENDAVVSQHATCETFEKDDSSSCKEMEAKYSDEQPNVDISADSNANDMLPSASNPIKPSSSDHIELPSASDHTELSSASDHVKLPMSDHIDLPSPSDHIQRSSASDHIAQPSRDHIELPAVSDHTDLPSPDYIQQSSASDHIVQPSRDRIELPAVSDHTDLPSPDHIQQSSTSDHIAQPSRDRIELPAVSDHTDLPSPDHIQRSSASDHIKQPSCDRIELPPVSDHIDLPSPSDHIPQSSTSNHIEPPSPRDHIELPSTSNCELSLATNHIDLSSPSQCSPVSTLPCAVANTNTECSPDSTAISDTETNCEAVSNAEVRLNTEDVYTAESSCNTEVVTNAESSSNTADVTNAETNADTEVASNSVASPTADAFDASKVDVCADSEVVTNAETSLTTEVTIAETSPNTEIGTNAEASHTEAVSNADSSPQPNETAGDASKVPNICDSATKETNPVDHEALDGVNNFFPTIVAIHGGCTDVLEKTSDPSSSNSSHGDVGLSEPPEMPTLNIVSVLGGCKDIDSDHEIRKTNILNDSPKPSNQIVNTISHSEETDVSNNQPVEDPEVICIETTAEIPPPIPIKMESNIEGLNVEAESRSFSKNGKFTAKKRLTRSSLSQSDDCIFLSSGSDADSVSDPKKRNRPSKKNAAYSTAGYTCHLCNTVFQEHELLNEHMILHRNNSLIEAKVQHRWKTSKAKPYSCDICQKQLSTSYSLQQHALIHKNEKPFACGVCKKEFRHLQAYRMHQQQQHKADQGAGKAQPASKEQPDKSVVRGADFGRLVGPLFMKESLWHQEKDAGSGHNPAAVAGFANKKTVFGYYTKGSVAQQPRLSFDQSPFKATPTAASPVIIRRREPSPESRSEDECVAVKSFSNIESVVMNAAKIIVKLDNLDTRVLKRKLQTPDICIDQAPKKCRIMLSPIAEKCNVKLDEIENIPMDVDVGDISLPTAEQMDKDGANEGPKDTSDSSVCPAAATLTTNEVFDLSTDDTVSTDVSDHGNNGRSEILKADHRKANNSIDSCKTAASPPAKQSNVIFVEAPPTHKMCAYEEEETVDCRLDDAFDTAFQKVALRRLALLQKRAAENGGKVDSRYLLGPLFWHKALRRAQRRTGDAMATNIDNTVGNSKNGTRAAALGLRASQFGGRSKFDNRRTNDPTKLQLRAERKFKYLLELAKMLDNLNSLNLAGPLFWRRTLRLAGVRRGEDLRTHVNIVSPTLDGVEFVDDGRLGDFDAAVPVDAQKTAQPSDPAQPSDRVQPSLSDQAEASLRSPVQPLPPDPMSPSPSRVQPSAPEVAATHTSESDGQSSDQLATGGTPNSAEEVQTSTHCEPPSYHAAADSAATEVASLKSDSILYESLTKQKEKQQPSSIPQVPSSYLDSASLFQGEAVQSSQAGDSRTEPVEGGANDQSNRLSGDAGIGKLAAIDAGGIVLNVDSGLQLIPANDQLPLAGGGQNFVLLSDGNGTMQYVVNVPQDNFGNFELIGNADGADQVAYAIQFNGENYAAVQFVQDGGLQLQSERGLKEAQMLVDPKAAYLVPDAGAAAAVADPNHIGRELSDFLNLDYDNLLKNGNANQPVS